MRSSTALALTLASFAAAQSTTSSAAASTVSSGSKCNAEHIVAACLSGFEPRRKACTSNDWECLCEVSKNMYTCYDNCPNSDASVGLKSEVSSYCQAADAAKPSSSKVASVSATATATEKSSATSTAEEQSATATSDASGSDSKDNAAPMVTSSFGAVGAVVGLMVMVGMCL